MTKEKIAVLYGGRSAEHEISVITALQCMRAIDTQKYELIPVYLALNGKWYTGKKLLDRGWYRNKADGYRSVDEITLLPDPSIGGFLLFDSKKTLLVDICLLAFHGQFGEDGSVQGLLELADLPYTGCNVGSASLAMNKYLSKLVARACTVPTLPCCIVNKKEAIDDFENVKAYVLETLSFPLFVKPNHLGSSIGIGKAESLADLAAVLAKVFQYDDQALIEPFIGKLHEINVAVLDGNPPKASLTELPVPTDGALSYEDKYLRGGGKSSGGISDGMAALSRVIDPQAISSSIKQQASEYALRLFHEFGCSGVCRFDFIYSLLDDKLYFNEVNPIPGSFSFYLWDKSSPPTLFSDLLESLLESAKERKRMQRSLNKEFGFHAL